MREPIKRCVEIVSSIGAESRFVKCDKAHIHYICVGCGKPVVFLHGFGAWSYGWRNQIKGLKDCFRLISIDLKGFGLSTRSLRTSYAVEAHAEAVACVLEHEGIKTATIVGNSFGGTVAMAVAVSFPTMVDAMILLAAPFRIELPTMPKCIFLPLIGPKLAQWFLFNEGGVEDAMRSNYADHGIITEETINAYLAPLRIRGTAYAWVKMLRQIDGFDLSDKLPHIHQRTLLIWGELDRTVPLSVGVELSKRLPNAELMVLSDVGHAPHEERPALINELVRKFLLGAC
jgi:pimeloyl-ACP methyl ester carboxylesterase